MSAYDNCILICYANSGVSLEYSMYFIDDEAKRSAEHGTVPLSEGAKLEWMGFSDEGKNMGFWLKCVYYKLYFYYFVDYSILSSCRECVYK